MTTKRIVTGAHYGLKDWLAQRITAVVLVAYLLYLLAVTLFHSGPFDYNTWYALFASPFMKVATLLAALALMWHAWIGVRDIWMDYAKPAWVRLLLEVLTIIVLLAYAAWTAVILWGA